MRLKTLLKTVGKLFGPMPSRRYQIPDSHPHQMEKIYLILKSMHYDVKEQSKDQTEFHLFASLLPSAKSFQKHLFIFKTISISLRGIRDSHLNWQIHLILHTTGLLSRFRTQAAELILEDLTQALGWSAFQLVPLHSSKNPYGLPSVSCNNTRVAS